MRKKTPFENKVFNAFPLPDRTSYSAQCRRKTDMVTRGRVEAAFADNLIFVTLTYDKDHLPTTYNDLKNIQLFHQRITRKKISTPTPKIRPILGDDFFLIENDYDDLKTKWIEKNSRPLNLKGNIFRHKEIFTEQDFKNAKHKFKLTYPDCPKKNYSLLRPSDLSDYLQFLRDTIRIDTNNPQFRLRFIANGEYGEHTFRCHFHCVIFNSLCIKDANGKDITEFYFETLTRMFWSYGKIIQVKLVQKSDTSIKKLTAYIVGHTVKNDSGNKYQSELSPAFRLMSTYDGGIGYQLTDKKLMQQYINDLDLTRLSKDDLFVSSLNFSLSSWDKKSELKYKIDTGKEVYSYEFPRYYKDKVQGYLNKNERVVEVSRCRMIRNLIRQFCEYYCLHDIYDLLDVFYNVGICEDVADILTLFMISNREKLQFFLAHSDNYRNIAVSFLESVKKSDTISRAVYRKRYANRKQEKKYLTYLRENGYYDLD